MLPVYFLMEHLMRRCLWIIAPTLVCCSLRIRQSSKTRGRFWIWLGTRTFFFFFGMSIFVRNRTLIVQQIGALCWPRKCWWRTLALQGSSWGRAWRGQDRADGQGFSLPFRTASQGCTVTGVCVHTSLCLQLKNCTNKEHSRHDCSVLALFACCDS